MIEQPSYYSILTAEVRYDKNISANEKLLYSEITALTHKNGYCTATNGYFADLYGVSNNTISLWIANLQKYKYIISEVIYAQDTKQIIERRLYAMSDNRDSIIENRDTPITKNNDTPITKNREDNNTSNINITSTNNIKENILKEKTPETPKEINPNVQIIFDYWNSKGIIKHNKLTDIIEKSITKTLKTYTIEQIKTMIDRYATILNQPNYFFKYKWTLRDFLTRKSGIADFADDGSKWCSYNEWLKKGSYSVKSSGYTPEEEAQINKTVTDEEFDKIFGK